VFPSQHSERYDQNVYKNETISMPSRVNRVKHFSVEMLTRYIVNVNDQKGAVMAIMIW
jgi:hypothetical protein